MLTTAQLLAQAKAAQGIPSNYRLARVLGVPDRTIQRWNTGAGRPDDEHTARLAMMAGIDPGIAIASINVERDPTGPMRSVWIGIAERLQRAGVAAVLALLGITFTGGPDAGAMAAQPASASICGTPSVYYVYSLARFFGALRRVLALFSGLFSPSACPA